jgi:uncharacterized protein YkwD
VTWSQELADYAAGHAAKCVTQHSSSPYGENIAGGVSDVDLAALYQMWANEAASYDFNNPRWSETTGHFTQIVWKATTEIGCAWKACSPGSIFDEQYGNSLLLVCEYKSGGNWVDITDEGTALYFTENVGPKLW